MKKQKLIKTRDGKSKSKDILILKDYESLKSALNKTSMRILKELSEKEMYPMELAKKLNMHEQRIYYYMRGLIKNGLIKNTRTEDKRGGLARYYKTITPAFGVELDFGESEINFGGNHELQEFFKEFNSAGKFDGFLVVGSPDPHGPHKQRARDGHYASQLAMSIGNMFRVPDDFLVKLDVDVMIENKHDGNMILIGGPISNIVTNNIKGKLPIKYGKKSFREIVGKTGTYSEDSVGIICKIKNPSDKEKNIIVLAGNSSLGTKSAVLALTKYTEKVLKDYDEDKEFSRVVQGFDLDGDGKIDSIEVLE